MTNKYSEGPHITLQDFYVWLGCHFFMAGFEGIENIKIWWSENPIDMFEGAPFGLLEYMSGRRFHNIGAAIRYNNIVRGANQEDIAELRRHGVEVENEDCLPEKLPSGENENQIPGVHGKWVTPTTCPRRGDLNISDAKGGWKNHSWSSIAEMSEFDLFRICFPENFIWEVVIPIDKQI